MMRRNLLSESVASASSLPADNTVFKLGTNGLVGAQNNIFLDTPTNSRTANTITRYGNVTQGTFTPYSKEAGKWSNYFDGSTGYLTVPNSTSFAFDTGDFTIEMLVFNTGITSNPQYFSKGVAGSSGLGFGVDQASNKYSLYVGNLGEVIRSTTTVVLNTWVHLALVRSSGVIKLFVNGVLDTTVNNTSNLTTTEVAKIGLSRDALGYTKGSISNLRIVKGTALYTANFTPLTGSLTAVAGTVLLTCQDNRFKDSSPYNHVLTPTGNVKVSPFSPYANSAGYDASVYGGSGYFDGSGDYLQLPASSNWVWNVAGFRLEASVYLTAYTSNAGRGIVVGSMNPSTDSNAWSFGFNLSGNVVMYYWNGSQVTHDSGIKGNLNSFNWIELEVITSTTFKIYVNGIASQIFTVSGTPITPADPLTVGANNNAYLNGYISNLRITKAGTEVLNLKFANAGIRDESGMNNIETVGDAKVSSDGQGVVFDGNGDYLQLNSSETFLGTAAFSVSFDFIISGSGDHDEQHILQSRNANYVDLLISYRRSNKTCYFGGMDGATSSVSAPITLQDGVQYSASLTRNSSGSVKFTVNGTDVFTCISTTNLQANYWQIGKRYTSDGANHFFNGTIKNLTITKGA
jgi:hypothetical protein